MIEIILIYVIGLLQGIVFVTVPAAGTMLTSPDFQNLSTGEYGSIFIPMIIGAIFASLAGGKMGASRGLKEVLLFGLFSNIIAMLLFAATSLFYASHSLNYFILLIAMLFLGLGFGSTITILNTYVEKLFPNRTSSAMACMHTLLGLGTAVAPLLFVYFHSIEAWWADPLCLSALFGVLFALSTYFVTNVQKAVQTGKTESFSLTFWVFVGIIFLYGFCETTFGNWATIYLHKDKGLTTLQASYALSLFWAMVTAGRILVALLTCFISGFRIYIILPFLICLAFLLIPFFSGPIGNITLFGFAGLACSGFFPLTFSIGEKDFSSIASVIAGWLMAAYMLGYGVAAYGIGQVEEVSRISLNSIYWFAAIPAALMAALVMYVLRGRFEKGVR